MSTLLEQASLVLIPSGYKEDVVYSQIPTSGSGDLSFTRASNGTRVNFDGLVEVCPWNLVQQSETFDNATWTKEGSTITTNTTNAPNGTLTADTITENSAASTQHRLYQANSLTTNGSTYTFSCYVKQGVGTRDFALIATNAGIRVYYNLSTGAVGTQTLGTGTITNVGDGWYRITATGTATATGVACYLAMTNGATINSETYSGNGTSSLIIWGAQLVEGSSAKPYFPTTDRLNVPRLTYQNGGGGCPSLLLEPQRTNLLLNSGELNSWLQIDTSVTSNSTISPDGTQNADTVTATGSGSLSHLIYQNLAFTSGTAYTYSVFAKANTSNFVQMVFAGDFVANSYANFNLSNGTITASANLTPKIESMGNGWYRCSISATAGVSNTNSQIIYLINSGTASRGQAFTANGESVYLWGGQFEAGAYPTTYIPTTTASATRVVDSFSRNNIYTNGLITSSGGTWFVELSGNEDLIRSASAGGVFINTGTVSLDGNGFLLRNTTSASQKISIAKYISGTPTTLFNSTTSTLKVAIKWNGSTADIFVNGTKEVSATTFTTTAMENLISEGTNRTLLISQMDLFPTPLTDAECIALTTI
jgi:hypothetical protein